MMRKPIIVILVYFISTSLAFTERVPYQDIKTISIENEHYIVTHFHDWSIKTDENRKKAIFFLQNPFSQEVNNYAYIECLYRKSNVTLFKIPTIALTYIYLSPNNDHIVGLSKIKIDNPYQLIVLNLNGMLIYKKHIAVEEAYLSNKEFEWFRNNNAESFQILKKLGLICKTQKGVYIDYLQMNIHEKIGNSWDYLFAKLKRSHFSKNFWETTTNYITWYKEPDPEIKFEYESKILKAISLLDPAGKRFEIQIEKGCEAWN